MDAFAMMCALMRVPDCTASIAFETPSARVVRSATSSAAFERSSSCRTRRVAARAWCGWCASDCRDRPEAPAGER